MKGSPDRFGQLSQATIKEVEDELGLSANQRIFDYEQVTPQLLQGGIYIHVAQESYGLVMPSSGMKVRQISQPESESIVIGPQIAFVEDLETNLSIIRRYLPTPRLLNEQLLVGGSIPTKVALLYMDELADEANVQTMRQRIVNLSMDGLIDASLLAQYISDNEYSVFPDFQLTERPDRVVAGISQGQIAVMVDGSPYAILAPTSLLQFFHSPDDFYFRWSIATFVRLLRVVGMVFSLLLTPAYVASLTFHYELIPADLLISLALSRARVPFPPLMEALLLEGIIELLREAGARLPTKVGQTIGIVGGIVIGTAAVQAGFTSNILIIIVALGALSSFIAPSYMFGATIRVIRFPMILLAGMWGGIGIAVGFSFIITHLLRQTSLGRPYLSPIYPMRISDMKDSVIRTPLSIYARLPVFYRTGQKLRFDPEKAHRIEDVDE